MQVYHKLAWPDNKLSSKDNLNEIIESKDTGNNTIFVISIHKQHKGFISFDSEIKVWQLKNNGIQLTELLHNKLGKKSN